MISQSEMADFFIDTTNYLFSITYFNMNTIYISQDQVNLIKEATKKDEFLLTEAKADKALKKYIREYTNSQIAQYMDTPLRELPDYLQRALNPGEGESAMFNSVADNQNGNNRLYDFLKVNFYEQFGIFHDSGPKKYMEGLARISLTELGFYSFGSELQGNKIMRLGREVRIIAKHPEILENAGIELDGNLNGLSYDDFINYIGPALTKYRDEMRNDVNSYQSETPTNYIIKEIKDKPITGYGTAMMELTPSSYRYLESLEPYVDWCICGSRHPGMYGQYTSNGGKFYVCEKEGFKNVPREQGENCPLDEYGLSLICVLVGPDGWPENITTRWNHDFGGENHDNLSNAKQLQEILGVKYFDYFKPRKQEELASLNIRESKAEPAQKQVGGKVNAGVMDAVTACGTMEEGAEPKSDEYKVGALKGDDGLNPYMHVNEENDEKNNPFEKYFNDIANFMEENGLHVKPFPSVKLDWSDQDGIFIRTGYYSPDEKKVVLFCKDRHPKDILRSYAHEMVHHAQNLEGKDLNFTSNDDVKDNKKLEKLESEAYLKGNVFFRKWTEYKQSGKNSINESKSNKKVVNDEGEIVPENCEECGGKIGTYICGEPIYKCSKCGKYYGTVKFTLKESEIFEDTNPDDIDLSSFNIKRELNPKFWKNDLLDSRIRLKLLDIADDFIDFLGVNWVKPEDIIITGSLANYNWNKKYSDIDLHILIDFSKVDKRRDFVKKYFDSLKSQWNETHEGIKIFGFPVEVYVQDTNEVHTSTGVYSIDKNKWITEPEREKLATSKVNKTEIRNKVAKYVDRIDSLENEYENSKNDDYKIRKISEKAEKLFDEIKKERRDSLNGNKKSTEITTGNIIFKCLRRLNYLDKLYDLKTKTYDKMNSLP